MNVIDLSLFHSSNMDIADMEHLILEGQASIVNTAVEFLLRRAKDIQTLKPSSKSKHHQIMKLKRQAQKHKNRVRKLSKMHLACEDILQKLSEIRKIVKEDHTHQLLRIEEKLEEQLQLSDLIERDASDNIQCSNYIVGRSDSGFCNENQNIFNEEPHINEEEDIINKQQFYKFSTISPRLSKTKSNIL